MSNIKKVLPPEKNSESGALRVILGLLLSLEDAKGHLKPESVRVQGWKFVLGQVYGGVCLVGLMGVGTEGREELWRGVKWVRVDWVAREVTEYCVYLVWMLVLLHLCGVCLLRRYPHLLRYLPLQTSLFAYLLDSPIFTLLLSSGWSALNPTYTTTLYTSDTQRVLWKETISLIFACLYFIFQCFREFSHSISTHSHLSTWLLCRCTCYMDILRIALVHGVEICYFWISGSDPEVYLVVVTAVCGVTVGSYYVRVPYYSAFPGAVICGCMTFVGVGALAVLWGELTHATLFPAFGSLLVAPLLGAMVYYHFQYSHYRRVLRYHQERLHRSSLQLYQIEIGMRRYLFPEGLNAQHPMTVLLGLRGVLRKMQSRRWMLWIADYALNVEKNEPLARLKLAQVGCAALCNFEDTLTSLRLHRLLLKHPGPEPVECLRYFQRMKVVKAWDRQLCHTLVEFYSQLASERPDKGKICKYAKVMDENIRFLKTEYRSLIKDFPHAKDPPNLFASFLEDLLHIYDKAQTIRMRASVFTTLDPHVEYVDYTSKLGFFSKSTGLLFISASEVHLGVIHSANEFAHLTLGYSFGVLPGTLFTELIPQPYRQNHFLWVREFLTTSISLQHGHPSVMYLCNAQGYLVECVTTMTVTANAGPPMILLAFKPTECFREIALVTEEEKVSACTRELPYALGVEDTFTPEMRLIDLIPAIYPFYKANTAPFYSLVVMNRKRFCLFREVGVGKRTLKMMFVVDTEEEAKYWSGSTASDLSPSPSPPYSPLPLSHSASMMSDYYRTRSDFSADCDSPKLIRHQNRILSIHKRGKEVQFSGSVDESLPPKRGAKVNLTLMSAGPQYSASISNSSNTARPTLNRQILTGLSRSFRVLKYTTVLTVLST